MPRLLEEYTRFYQKIGKIVKRDGTVGYLHPRKKRRKNQTIYEYWIDNGKKNTGTI